jgi:fumarate hydratase subunit alpha
VIGSDRIAAAVYEAVRKAAVSLRPDVLASIEAAAEHEPSPRGRSVLAQMVQNAAMAEADGVPLCQDTGTVSVRIEFGPDVCPDDAMLGAVDAAVASAYRDGALRMSVVTDALLDRTNTGDNTPAFVDLVLRADAGARVDVMLKGGGSDNASLVAMLDPSEGRDGVRRTVLAVVSAKAASACPPLLIGVGVGSTFDRVAGLAKHALLRPIGGSGASDLGTFEQELLDAVNATGIGPGGFGGRTTALAVHVETAPCHIAALPVAVNLGCCAVRSAFVELT